MVDHDSAGVVSARFVEEVGSGKDFQDFSLNIDSAGELLVQTQGAQTSHSALLASQ